MFQVQQNSSNRGQTALKTHRAKRCLCLSFYRRFDKIHWNKCNFLFRDLPINSSGKNECFFHILIGFEQQMKAFQAASLSAFYFNRNYSALFFNQIIGFSITAFGFPCPVI